MEKGTLEKWWLEIYNLLGQIYELHYPEMVFEQIALFLINEKYTVIYLYQRYENKRDHKNLASTFKEA